MRRSIALPSILLTAFLLAGQLPAARAAIVLNGDVDPNDAGDWDSGTSGYIGDTGFGTLDVNDGSDLYSYEGYLGDAYSSTGVAMVDGAGSTWTNTTSLYAGNAGIGILRITDGGTVSSLHGYVGYSSRSTGAVTVDGAGSRWSNKNLLYVGYSGSGTINITGGATVSAYYADAVSYIGYHSGSVGVVAVDRTGSTWIYRGDLYVGHSGSGTINITGGATAVCTTDDCDTYVGYNPGSMGVVTVDGAGSTWTNTGDLYVGHSGSGLLSITSGAVVSVAHNTFVADQTGSAGRIHFGSGGGTLDTRALYASFTDLLGTGTIRTHGLVSDVDLVFDSIRGANQLFTLASQPGQSVTVNLDVSGNSGVYGDLGVGFRDEGSLIIRDGVVVASESGYIAYAVGTTGVATVDGAGSTWNNRKSLFVGRNAGRGTLDITDGAVVRSSTTYVGLHSGSTGTVTIDGTDSELHGSSNVIVGFYGGSGTLDVSGGGGVITCNGYIGQHSNSTGEVTIDGAGSTWTNSSKLYVGYNGGSGTFNVTGGAALSSPIGYVSSGSGSMGVVVVDGAGSTWTNSGDLYVGDYRGSGTLSITNGATVTNSTGYVGNFPDAGSIGVVTVDGDGSTWTSTDGLYIGCDGSNGTLNITGNAAVSVGDRTYLADGTGATGLIDFGGGTLSTRTLFALPSQLQGTGTINARGLVSDLDLVFDATHGSNQTFTLGSQPDQNIVVNLDVSGTSGDVGDLGSGYRGSGSLSIRDGTTVTSARGFIGYNSGSTGQVTVDGVGSTWTSGDHLDVGYYGSGTLEITDGGAVSNRYGYVGYRSGSTGVASVDGTGSTWTNSSELTVRGTLSITGGGHVGATSLSSNSALLLAIDVGRGSLLTFDGGSGTIYNGGIVRVLAATDVEPGDYWPIAAGTWSGSGIYQGLGGRWDAAAHKLVVADVELGEAAVMMTIDPAVTQRVVISDDATGWTIGAGFLASATSKSLHFTATPIDPATLADLALMLEDGEGVRGAWTFEIGGSGYAAGDPVYLSFGLGGDFARSDLNVWHFDGTEWTPFDATDLTYDGQYASFTVTGFSGYAVSVVPEPGTLAMLAGAVLGLLVFARRKRK